MTKTTCTHSLKYIGNAQETGLVSLLDATAALSESRYYLSADLCVNVHLCDFVSTYASVSVCARGRAASERN